MSTINDRGNKIGRYLRSRTGFPFITWAYAMRGFDMPAGYSLSLRTSGKSDVVIGEARELKNGTGIDAVAYAHAARDTDDVVVLMPVRVYVELLALHIENKHLTRVRNGE